jgi:hypothetical protein
VQPPPRRPPTEGRKPRRPAQGGRPDRQRRIALVRLCWRDDVSHLSRVRSGR